MLGTYMLRTLAALNDSEHYDMKLYGLVRHPEKMPEDLKKRVSLITQSVSREIETDVRFDYIIHAASPASPLIMREDPAGTIAANTLGTYYTLELARKSNAKGYLFISSREIYGQPYEGQREFTEDTYGFVDPLEPRSCYPEGKKSGGNHVFVFPAAVWHEHKNCQTGPYLRPGDVHRRWAGAGGFSAECNP